MKTKSQFTFSPPDIHHASGIVGHIEKHFGQSVVWVFVEYPDQTSTALLLPVKCGLKKGDLVEILIRKIP